MDTNVVEIDRYVAASPGTVYALVSDIARTATGAPGRVSAAGSAPRLARSWARFQGPQPTQVAQVEQHADRDRR